jgi:hypothetical protein
MERNQAGDVIVVGASAPLSGPLSHDYGHIDAGLVHLSDKELDGLLLKGRDWPSSLSERIASDRILLQRPGPEEVNPKEALVGRLHTKIDDHLLAPFAREGNESLGYRDRVVEPNTYPLSGQSVDHNLTFFEYKLYIPQCRDVVQRIVLNHD